MFDIGFWELAIIGVVALLVIGPERLPAVARTVGVWVGKARRFVSSVQADINQEINKSEELAKLLEEQAKLKDMHEIIEQTVDETRKTVAVGNEQFQRPAHEPKPMQDDTPKDNAGDKLEDKLEDKPNAGEEQSASQTKPRSADVVNDKTQ